MSKEINLRKNTVQQGKRQVQTYGTQTPLSSTAVERGRTRWLDGSEVVIEGLLNVRGVTNLDGTNNLSGDNNLSGPTEVTGTLTITGATTIGGSLDVTGPTNLDGVLTINGDTTITGILDVTGPISLDGEVTINGDTSVTGKLDVTGPTAIKGTLGIEGVTTLKNDLNVTTGGTIKAGSVEIEPTDGGQINFLGGSLSSSATFGALLNNSTAVELQAPTVRLRATTTEATGQLKVNSTPIKAASQLTALGIDANGIICRIG